MSEPVVIDHYRPYPGCFDELIAETGQARSQALAVARFIARHGADELKARQKMLDATIAEMGISFTVYSDSENIDRYWPLDVVPRTIAASDWRKTSAGLK